MNNVRNKILEKKDLVYILFIFSGIIIFFNEIIFTNKNFFIGDIYSQFFPWKEFIKNSIQAGSLPFWDPFTFSGNPFLADIQKGVFYPLGIFFVFFDFSTALKMFILIHYFLMGIFIYIFLKYLQFTRIACVTGTFLYLFNTFTFSKIVFFNGIATLTFFPLLLLLIDKVISKKKTYDFILIIFIISLKLLSGCPPIFYYSILFSSFYLFFLLFQKEENYFNIKKISSGFILVIITFIFVILLTLPQTALFFELFKNSERSASLTYQMAAADSVSFVNLLSFFMPGGINGINIDPNKNWLFYSLGNLNFFSVTFIFLFVISLFLQKNNLVYFCYGTILFSILLILGNNTPVYSWFYAFFPGFSLLRHPGLAITLLLIPSTIISSFVIKELEEITMRQLSLFYSVKGTGVNIERYIDVKMSGKILKVNLIFFTLFFLILLKSETIIKIYNLNIFIFRNFIFGCLFFIVLFTAHNLFLFFREKFYISKNFYIFLILIILFGELFYVSKRINPVIDADIYNLQKLKLKTVDLIKTSSFKFIHTDYVQKERSSKGKTLYEAQYNYLLSLPSNTGSLYNLSDAYGYNPIILKDYNKFISDIFSGDTILNKEKLNLLNVKYIFARTDTLLQYYNKIYDGFIKIYLNSNALPLFFMSEEKANLKQIMVQTAWSRKNESDYNYYKINLKTIKSGYFIFSNCFYNGWKAFVDNQAVRIEKCFDIYMGIKINTGDHTIIFKYYPENLDIFIIIYYFIILLLILFALIYKRYLTKNF